MLESSRDRSLSICLEPARSSSNCSALSTINRRIEKFVSLISSIILASNMVCLSAQFCGSFGSFRSSVLE